MMLQSKGKEKEGKERGEEKEKKVGKRFF